MMIGSGKRPAAFIDRDGTLIEEVNFLSRVEDLRVFPHTAEALRQLRSRGYLLVVVTNQSGIGRGLYTESDMRSIHAAMQTELGGIIDGFYHCPHLPDAGCECRKPGIGMLRFAERDLEIDLAASWMIGDKRIDVETGQNANIRSALVLTGYGTLHRDHLVAEPDVIGETLLEAVEEIVSFGSAAAGL
ncbi:MAG: D-glycero-alpha-D-manno-heptose-1,7-bisphosphate 7-phosphatase [Pyrinomonadaceae bacterium]